eukprot:365306-Chlamydomonas_euryale.AAC.5
MSRWAEVHGWMHGQFDEVGGCGVRHENQASLCAIGSTPETVLLSMRGCGGMVQRPLCTAPICVLHACMGDCTTLGAHLPLASPHRHNGHIAPAQLRGALKVVAVKAPGFGERKTSYLEDIAILTGGTMVKDELGVSLDKADESVLGLAAKVLITKEACTIVGDGSTQREVSARVSQIRNLVAATEQEYEREKLNERIARLSGGVAIIQVGAQTETELKEKKLRVEDALNATKAAVEEGVVIGGGCTLLKLAAKVNAIKETLANDEQKLGADIIRKALAYPIRLISSNAGVNGSVVMQKVLEKTAEVPNYGYNAANDTYGDLMEAGIIDPTKVVRCTLENAVSVAKTFLLADVVVTEIPEPEGAAAAGMGAGDYGM